MEPLYLPVIEGTARKDRRSIHAARLITEVGNTIDGVRTELIDPPEFDLPYDGNDDIAKDPRYTKITAEADGFFLVVPEYNHSFPGTLKRILDSELKNYLHKPVAFAGVSVGPWGGVRGIESLVPSVREMGLVATHTDVQFPNVGQLFDDEGQLQDQAYIARIKRAFAELIWMAGTLKHGRKNVHKPEL